MEEVVVRFPRPIQINSLANYWIRDYRANRYLRRLSKNDLLARIADIVSNLMALRDDGIYRPRFRVREDRIYASIRNLDFLRMETDAWEEMRLRGDLPLPMLDTKRLQIAKRLSDESWCRRPDWIARSRLGLDKYEQPRMLFRFSKTQWNNEFIQAGRVRISPASYYNDTAASNAVRDDELRLKWYDKRLTQGFLRQRTIFVCAYLRNMTTGFLLIFSQIAVSPSKTPWRSHNDYGTRYFNITKSILSPALLK